MFLGDSFALRVDVYPFPVVDPHKATFLSSASEFLLPADNYNPTSLRIEADYENRSELKYFEGRDYTSVRVAYHPYQNRPTVYILGGLGASGISGLSVFYQKLMFRAGFNAVTIPSNFFWKFNLAHIASATPGYLERDKEDIYSYMLSMENKMKEIPGYRSSGNHLLGYSMGALTAVFISEIDDQLKHFNFGKVAVINPPIDLYESASKLDGEFPYWRRLDTNQQKRLEGKVFRLILSLGEEFSDRSPSDEEAMAIIAGLPFEKEQYRALIASNFLETLAPNLLVSELVREWGIIPIYYDIRSPQPSLNAAREFGFISYFNKVLFPDLPKVPSPVGSVKDHYIKKMGLLGKLDYLRESEHIKVFHNEDDIIVSGDSIKLLEEALPEDRIQIYPLGGHLGNVWFPMNIKDLLGFFMTP